MNNFDILENNIVITSKYIIEDRMPILLVLHQLDEDGITWQFHADNDDYSMDKMLIVGLGQIIETDPSIYSVSNLPLHHQATRRFVGDSWVFSEE